MITTIIMQIIDIVWWAASLSARVETLQHRFFELDACQARIARLEKAVYQRLYRNQFICRCIETIVRSAESLGALYRERASISSRPARFYIASAP